MKRVFAITAAAAVSAVAAALVGVHPGIAQNVPINPPQAQPGQISVLGDGLITASPNVARVTLGVDVRQDTLAGTLAEANSRMATVIQKLKDAGIADDRIRTINFSVNPVYDNQNNQQTLRGYQVQNIVEARDSDLKNLGALVDQVVSAGATRVNSISFESDNPGALKDQARDQAMQNALAKAQQLARAAGVSLGKAIIIEESDASGATPVPFARAAAPQAALANSDSVPIQAGQLEVRTNVRVVYAIQ